MSVLCLKCIRQVFVEIGDWRPLFPTRVGEELGDIGAARFNVYNRELEQNLLATTSEFYARESAQWIATDSCPEYMKKVNSKSRLSLLFHKKINKWFACKTG